MYVTEGFNWTPPSAWGMPRTPLLPKWYIEVLGSVPLPPNIGFALFGRQDTTYTQDKTHTIGDLKDYWDNHSEPVPSHALRSLLRLVSKHQQPPDDYHVIPPNVAVQRISVCPLSVRIQNCLRRYWRNPSQDAGQDVEQDTGQPVDQSLAKPITVVRPMTVGFLMSLQNFGITSLIELMCVMEAAIDNGLLLPSQPPQFSQLADGVPQSSVDGDRGSSSDAEPSYLHSYIELPTVYVPNEASSDLKPFYSQLPATVLGSGWAASIPLLQQLISVAAEFHSAETLADALTCDLKQLMDDLDVAEEIGSVSLSDLVPKRSLTEDSLDACRQFCETLSSSQREILTQRIISTDAPSLAELARGMDVTGEAVRRSEKRLEDNINELCGKLTSSNNPSASSPLARWLNVTTTAISSQHGDITTQNDLQASITHALGVQADPVEVNHNKVNHNKGEADSENEADSRSEADSERALPYLMAEYLLKKELGYVSVGEDDICLNKAAAELVEDLKETAKSIADNVGLVDELALRSRLSSDMSEDHADTLIDQCGFTRFHDHLALRDTGKARVKAALMQIGRPATKEEIAKTTDFDVARVSSLLSSVEDVVRASKTKWGVEEWVDDVYEGIPAEIIQRINEDGGSTALSRLTEELPRMFEVNETSVTAYVATSRFQLVDGNVSLADVSSINLRSLADTVEGYTSDGRACWKFKVEARYFNGYSLLGLPPEIAKALGCEPDGRKRVPVRSPSSCGPISVGWPLTSLGGASLGYLSEPLRKLRLNSGDHALLVINNDNTVSIQPDAELLSEPLTVQLDDVLDASASDSAPGGGRTTHAEAMLYASNAEAISSRGAGDMIHPSAGDTTHSSQDYRHQDYTRGRDKLERIKNRRKVF